MTIILIFFKPEIANRHLNTPFEEYGISWITKPLNEMHSIFHVLSMAFICVPMWPQRELFSEEKKKQIKKKLPKPLM